VPAVVLGGAATITVAAIWWKAFPALRKVDRFPGSWGTRRAAAQHRRRDRKCDRRGPRPTGTV